MPIDRAPGAADPATAPSGGAVVAHLARMHAQRVTLFETLAGVPEERLWERAAAKSLVQVLGVGVHHDHHHYQAVRRLLGR